MEPVTPALLQHTLDKYGVDSPEELLKLSPAKAQKTLNMTAAPLHQLMQTAAACVYPWQDRHTTLKNTTVTMLSLGDTQLDRILGGIPLGSITEIVGESSAGKTQMALQLCFTVQSVHGEAVYICNEGKLPLRRLDALAQHYAPNDLHQQQRMKQRIHTMHITDAKTQYSCLAYQLPLFLDTHPNVRLVIIDSISALYRSQPTQGPYQRFDTMEEVCDLGMRFKKITAHYSLAMVVLNQVSDTMDNHTPTATATATAATTTATAATTTATDHWLDFSLPSMGLFIQSLLKKPVLGYAWSNAVTTRVRVARSPLLDGMATRRIVCVEFSPFVPRQACEFVIGQGGISALL